MKRLFAILSIIGLLLTSCEPIIETPSTDEDNLLVNTKILYFTAEGGNGEIEYSISQPTEGLVLEARSDNDWISNIAIDNRITFAVEANQDAQQRIGFIKIGYGAESYTVTVEQSGNSNTGGSVTIIIAERKKEIDAKGGTYEIGYTISGAEEGIVPDVEANAEWFEQISVDSEKLTFVAANNSSNEERKATITLSYDEAVAKATITQKGAVYEVVITASSTTVRAGQSVTFNVEYAGEDVTQEATICDYYTHNEMPNPTTFDEVGEYAIIAKYNNSTSKLISIIVYPASAPDFPVDSDALNYNFKYRMLLIDHTGTDCGYCPYMMQSLKEIEEDSAFNDYFNIAMAHSYNTSDAAYSYTALTMRYYYQKTLNVLTGFPTLTYNYQYANSASSNISNIKQHFNKLKKESTDAAVAVAAKLDGDKIVVSASLKSKVARLYKVNILLLEDDIYSKQYNAWETWMSTHNNAIRASYATISQSDISGAEWGYVAAESTSHKVFELPIENTNWVKSNCKVLVIIAAQDANYGNKYEVVNTTMCDLNESKPFEYR